MTPDVLIYPMLAHVSLTALLYAALTLVRAPAVWGMGRLPDGTNPWAGLEPRVSANLRNQFEWPIFFHVVGLLLQARGGPMDPAQLWLAWTFVAGRLAHSCVQIFIPDVRLRGVVFTINFVAVLGMWALLLASWP